jgi:hypothetical protein
VNVVIRTRAFGELHSAPRLQFIPRTYSWQAVGGPHVATIDAVGPAIARWELFNLLRCPVEIYNDQGEIVWWGYVADVEVSEGAITARASIDTLVNRVAVAYAYTSEANTVGERATTAYAQDDLSVDEYGTFERLESSGTSNPTAADAQRDQFLAQYRYPTVVTEIRPGENKPSATVQCRGWFTTLSRRMWAQPLTGPVGNVEQIALIVDEVGEFLTGTDILAAGAIAALDLEQYRDGDVNAQEEIEELLQLGSNGRRLLATVTRERILRLTEELAPGVADLLLRTDGSLHDRYDAPLPQGSCPAGQWARLVDVIPPTVDTSMLADPGSLFMERIEWDVRKNHISRIEPRGASAFDVSNLERV